MSELKLLDWDSAQFGFPVGRLEPTNNFEHLRQTLEGARAAGMRLAYLALPSTVPSLDAARLASMHGVRLDDRVTYVAQVQRDEPWFCPAGASADNDECDVVPFSGSVASADLIRLARTSGAYSRFRVDRRIERSVFEAIYDAWITRSVRGELADRVAVARRHGKTVGLVTMRNLGLSRGEIGLCAVDEAVRGRGIGRRLVCEALRWTHERGLNTAQVITQSGNRPACALYESCGYVVESAEQTYHFWL